MSTVSKKRPSGTVNNDVWRYRTVNNIKLLSSFHEVPRFISGMCRQWKIDKYSGGSKFIQNFCDSIQDYRDTHLDGFEYVNDTDICYFLLLTKPHHDGRSTEVIFTHHTLSKSSINVSDSSEVIVEEHKALTWLKQRACNELHLPSQTTQKLMYKSMNYPTINMTKCHIYPGGNDKTSSAQEVKSIIQESNPAASYQGWRYFLLNKTKHNKSLLECIPEIDEYSQHCDSAEKFYEDLERNIQGFKNLTQLSYPFFHQNELCTLIMCMQAINGYVIEIACRFQTVVEQSL